MPFLNDIWKRKSGRRNWKKEPTLASFLPKNTQDWSPLGWTGWISLHSRGLSRVLSNTTVQKHQFFSAQLSSHMFAFLKLICLRIHGVAKSQTRLSDWTQLLNSNIWKLRTWNNCSYYPWEYHHVPPGKYLPPVESSWDRWKGDTWLEIEQC